MKKNFLSAILTLVMLAMFGLITFVFIARPAGFAQNAETQATFANSVSASRLALSPPFVFDPQAVNYEISQPNYEWIDISAGSDEQIQITASEFEDNVGSAAIEIGFYFPFFSQIYRQLSLSDNGYIYFGGDETTGGNTPQAVPSSVDLVHNLIAPFGADLFRNPEDSVVYIASQSEPERRLVIQVENAYWCCNLENPNDFQLVLYPDGRILSQYKSINSDNPPHAFLTVGLENKDGTGGHNFYTGFLDETDNLHNQLAVLYDPGETILGRLLFVPEAGTAQGAPDQTVTFNADLLNLSGVDSHFTISQTMQVNGLDVPLQSVESPEDEAGTDEAGDSEESTEPSWRMRLVAEPGQVANTDAGPLTVEIIIPKTATGGDLAVITFYALPEAITDLEAIVTFTVEVIEGNP